MIVNTLLLRKNIIFAASEKNTAAVHGLCSYCLFLSVCLTEEKNPNTSQFNFAFKLSGLTQKGTVFPHTSSGKSENQKDSEIHLTVQWGENSFCHCCHSQWDYSGDQQPILPLDLPCIQSLLGVCGCIMKALLPVLSAQLVLCLESIYTAVNWVHVDDGHVMQS